MKHLFRRVVGGMVAVTMLFAPHFSFAEGEINLLINPDAETEDFSGWTKTDGGDGWLVGSEGDGEDVNHYFISSHAWGTLSQEVDLLEAGYTEGQLDSQPLIDMGVWVRGTDIGSGVNDPYVVIVELRDAEHTSIASYTTGTQAAAVDWTEVSHTFTEYGTGARYAYIELRGRDTNSWEGHYGSAFDDAWLFVAGDMSESLITGLSPADDATNASRNANLVITFNEPVMVTEGNVTIYRASDDEEIEAIDVTSDQVTGSGTNTITINPSVTLANRTEYYALIDEGAFEDMWGNAFTGITEETTWNFRTRAPSSDSAPTAVVRDYTISAVNAQQNGNAVNLTWNAGDDVRYVAVYLSRDAGVTWSTITSSLMQSSAYAWHIPAAYAGEIVMFKVASTDLAVTMESAVSNSVALSGVVVDEESADNVPQDDTAAPSSRPTIGPSPVDGSMQEVSFVQPGMYIKSPSFSTVYYVTENYERRPFSHATIFFTYEESFDNVVMVTDATLPTLRFGEIMPPKPGVVLVKTQYDPTTYAVNTGAQLRVIASEDEAAALYGSAWSEYIIDIDPTLFAQMLRNGMASAVETIDMAKMKTRAHLANLIAF